MDIDKYLITGRPIGHTSARTRLTRTMTLRGPKVAAVKREAENLLRMLGTNMRRSKTHRYRNKKSRRK